MTTWKRLITWNRERASLARARRLMMGWQEREAEGKVGLAMSIAGIFLAFVLGILGYALYERPVPIGFPPVVQYFAGLVLAWGGIACGVIMVIIGMGKVARN